jgi:TolB-like protein/DNA-binding winged helix-turn-helix (wHTH) protein
MDIGVASGWIVFDAVEIDVAGRRVFVAGSEISLEPRAFAVLSLLARHPGRAFARDEILDTVWGHQHVTPGALNRVVTLIRQALGESADEHRYLHTLHGVGYRFDAAVRFETERANAPWIPAPTNLATGTGVIHGDIGAAPPSERTALAPIESPSIESSPAPLAHPATPIEPLARNGRFYSVVAAGVLVALLAAIFWRARQPASGLPTASVPAIDSSSASATKYSGIALIVLPPRVIVGTPDDAAFADSLGEELISVLAHLDGLHVIARTSAAVVQTGGEDLATVSKRLGISHALESSVRREGEQLRVSLRLVEIASGRSLWAEQYDHASTGLLALERDVAKSVSGALALKLAAESLGDLAHGDDPVLYRRYLEARHLARSKGFGKRDETLAAYRSLIADAPDYARGHGGYALALSRMPTETPEAAHKLVALASAEAERALQLDPTLADANAVAGHMAANDGAWERAVELGRRAVERAPADTSVRITYARSLIMLGYFREALEQAQVAHAADPLSPEANFFLACVLDTVGRHEDAVAHYKVALGTSGNHPVFWFDAIRRGDFAEARTILQQGQYSDDYFAVTEALEDPSKWPAARERIAAAEQKRPGYLARPRLLDPEPDIPRDIAGLETMWRDAISPDWMLLWSRELTNHRRHPAFGEFLRRNHIIDYWRAHGFPPQCKPEGDGARCD